MMQKLSLLLIGLVSLTSPLLQAQNNAEVFRPKHLGFSLSTLTGMNMYYIQDLSYWDNLKFSALFLSEYEDEAKFSLGIEYQRDLIELKWLRFYGLAGTAIDNTLYRFDACNNNNNRCYYTNYGLGAGLELKLFKNFVFNIHSTYQISNAFADHREKKSYVGAGLGVAILVGNKD
ncbi:MAG: hypothetical protein NXI08_11675 [bacterium]|nr:hypothetical protein [bacterium]